MLFISYSHEDHAFVDRLAARLLKERVAIWWDRVEIKVGDSLLEKIQGAISASDHLVIVLSTASVASRWCREELNAALMRQLAEKRVLVLPLLATKCQLPAFLLDKKYADFTGDFEVGLAFLLEAIAPHADPTLGRQESDEYQSDYALDWMIKDGRFAMDIDAVSFSKKQQYSVMSQTRILGNEVATRRYLQFADAGLGDLGMTIVVAACQAVFDSPEAFVHLDDAKAVSVQSSIRDQKTSHGFDVTFWARRIGQPTGMSIIYHFGAIFGDMFRQLISKKRPLSAEEKRALAEIISAPPR